MINLIFQYIQTACGSVRGNRAQLRRSHWFFIHQRGAAREEPEEVGLADFAKTANYPTYDLLG